MLCEASLLPGGGPGLMMTEWMRIIKIKLSNQIIDYSEQKLPRSTPLSTCVTRMRGRGHDKWGADSVPSPSNYNWVIRVVNLWYKGLKKCFKGNSMKL